MCVVKTGDEFAELVVEMLLRLGIHRDLGVGDLPDDAFVFVANLFGGRNPRQQIGQSGGMLSKLSSQLHCDR